MKLSICVNFVTAWITTRGLFATMSGKIKYTFSNYNFTISITHEFITSANNPPPRLLATVNIAWARLRTRGVRDTWLDVYGTNFVSQANEILIRVYDCHLSSVSNVCRLFVRWKIGQQHGDCNIGVCRRTIWSPTEHWVLPDPNRSVWRPL